MRPARCGLTRDVRDISGGTSSVPNAEPVPLRGGPIALPRGPRPAPPRYRHGAPGAYGARAGLADAVARAAVQAARAHQGKAAQEARARRRPRVRAYRAHAGARRVRAARASADARLLQKEYFRPRFRCFVSSC